ncbi:hypothetical protein PC9H_004219 [Pleurotus ostreatus]|uniref:DUF952 domain-containing protein n=1 Tax=Pleurotus ostreatus TaxID=5322 RepID=A0A8H6ZZU8_PLEOS|nr:uncharacterized protein PC9H_004219 [Pleurotus ostreatus]KAF7437380.1 hypothetical protein PC9H_004219 [Pleurotus ostreatus]
MANIHQATYVYKLVHPTTPPPDPLPASLPLSELDVQSGFIHLSTARQVPGTLKLFFTDEPRMYVLRIPIKAIEKDLRWEAPSVPVSGDGDVESTFPHLYNRTLGSAEVESVALWEKGEGTWDNVLGTEEVTSWLFD